MNEFFRGWRRKVELLSLLMACLFMGGYVRSHSVRDTFNCWVGRRIPVLFISTSGFILWGNVFLDPGSGATFAYWTTDAITDANIVSEISDDDSSQRQWFKIVTMKSATTSHPFWVVSYWCFILPPTVLSAFLLISKPKKIDTKENCWSHSQ